MTFKPEKLAPFLTRENLAFEGGAAFRLRLTVFSSVADTLLLVGATKEGPFKLNALCGATNAEQNFNFDVPDIPIWISVIDRNGSFGVGTTHATVSLLINRDVLYFLVAGYVYHPRGISWPQASDETKNSFKSAPTIVTGTNPAANVEVSETMGAGLAQTLKSFRVTLVTDGTAATRQVHLLFNDNSANVLLDLVASGTQTASLTRNYNFMQWPGGSPANSGTEIYTAIPRDFIFLPDWTITTVTDNRQLTDNYGAPIFYVAREKFTQ